MSYETARICPESHDTTVPSESCHFPRKYCVKAWLDVYSLRGVWKCSLVGTLESQLLHRYWLCQMCYGMIVPPGTLNTKSRVVLCQSRLSFLHARIIGGVGLFDMHDTATSFLSECRPKDRAKSVSTSFSWALTLERGGQVYSSSTLHLGRMLEHMDRLC